MSTSASRRTIGRSRTPWLFHCSQSRLTTCRDKLIPDVSLASALYTDINLSRFFNPSTLASCFPITPICSWSGNTKVWLQYQSMYFVSKRSPFLNCKMNIFAEFMFELPLYCSSLLTICKCLNTKVSFFGFRLTAFSRIAIYFSNMALRVPHDLFWSATNFNHVS